MFNESQKKRMISLAEQKKSRRGFLKAAGGAIVAAAVAIGAYELYQTSTAPAPAPTTTVGPSTPVTTVAPSTPVTTAKPFAGTTINFQTLDPVTTVATDLKSKFTDRTGINVNVITVGVSEDMNEKNLLVLTGHTGSVDVLTNFVWMIGQNSAYYDELTPFVGKYNLDLSDYIQWDLDQSCRYDDAHKFVKVGGGGALYALPWDADLNMLLYRKDWFSDPKEMDAFKAKYGYDLQVPEAPDALTWKQFCDIIEFFSQDRNKESLDTQDSGIHIRSGNIGILSDSHAGNTLRQTMASRT